MFVALGVNILDRLNRWVLLVAVLHLTACLLSFIGLVLPIFQHLEILFTFVLVADIPISLPSYPLAWKFPLLSAIWTFVFGTLWWYLLSLRVQVLFEKYSRAKVPQA